MWWPMFPSRSESLALALQQLVIQGGIESVTMRALARELRTAPGTITNSYRTRVDVLAVCTTVIGRLVGTATLDRLSARGLAGLLPSQRSDTDLDAVEDQVYRELLLAWSHLEVHALVCSRVAEQVGAATLRARSLVDLRFDLPPGSCDAAWWAHVRGLQVALLVPGTALTPELAASQLAAPRPTPSSPDGP